MKSPNGAPVATIAGEKYQARNKRHPTRPKFRTPYAVLYVDPFGDARLSLYQLDSEGPITATRIQRAVSITAARDGWKSWKLIDLNASTLCGGKWNIVKTANQN